MDNQNFPWGLVIRTIDVEGYTFKKYHPYQNGTFTLNRSRLPDREKVLYHIYVNGRDTNTSTHTLEGAMLVAVSTKMLGAHTPGLGMVARALKLPEDF